MNAQLYTAASGMLAEGRRVELIANNLANLSTQGFRALRAFTMVYEGVDREVRAAIRPTNRTVAIAGAYQVPGPGPLRLTGRVLDVALDDKHLLAVQTERGRRYTRDGALQISPTGDLVDSRNHRVLGRDGRPVSGLSQAASVTSDGRVVDGDAELGRLLVVRDPGETLIVEGNNLFSAEGNDEALESVEEPRLRTGWLEGSATNALGELVGLIEAQRAFQSYQRIISLTMNEVNRRAVNDIAR